MGSTNRRTFLKQSAVAAASVALPVDPPWSLSVSPASGPRAWVTAGEDRFRETSVAPWQPASEISGPIIEIDPARRFQSILGFGGAFTDSSCYLLSRMDSASRQKLLDDLLGRDGLRMSVCRTCIGSSDYSLSAYSFDDTPEPDPDLTHFSIDHDKAYILPMLRAAQQSNPESLPVFRAVEPSRLDEGGQFSAISAILEDLGRGRLKNVQLLFSLYLWQNSRDRRGVRNPARTFESYLRSQLFS